MLKKFQHIKAYIKDLTSRIVLPGCEGQNLFDVGKFFVQGLSSANVATRAASVTYRFLMAAFPLIICIFSLIPFVPIDHFQEDILTYIRSFFPSEVYAFFDDALVDLITYKRTFLLSIGFAVTIYLASSGINALLEAFSSSYHLDVKRKFHKQILWSLLLLFAFMVFAILLTLISGFGQMLIDYLSRKHFMDSTFSWTVMTILKNVILFFLYYSVISMLYNIGHTEREKWKYFTAGTTMATLLIILFQKGFSMYLTDIAKFDKLYGPLGAFLGFMLFFYYLFYLLIIGFELNLSIHHVKKMKRNTEKL